jgi:hypothetical protein
MARAGAPVDPLAPARSADSGYLAESHLFMHANGSRYRVEHGRGVPQPSELERFFSLSGRGGLVVALVAAAASGVIGAAVGGIATNHAATTQIKAQREQSRAEFIRSQEQAAYVELLGDALAAGNIQGTYYLLILQNDPGHAAAARDEVDQINRLLSDEAKVALIGSPEAAAAALALRNEYVFAHNALLGLASALPQPVSQLDQQARVEQTGRLSRLTNAFQDAAKRDLRS